MNQVLLRRFRDPIRVPRISNRVPKIRENRVPRIRGIGSLQIQYSYFRGFCAFVWFRHKQKCLLRFVMRYLHVSLTSRPVVLNLSWFVALFQRLSILLASSSWTGFCNVTAEIFSKGLCSWPTEDRSVPPKGGRGVRLRNPDLGYLSRIFTTHRLRMCQILCKTLLKRKNYAQCL